MMPMLFPSKDALLHVLKLLLFAGVIGLEITLLPALLTGIQSLLLLVMQVGNAALLAAIAAMYAIVRLDAKRNRASIRPDGRCSRCNEKAARDDTRCDKCHAWFKF